jgi:hypothetical protein
VIDDGTMSELGRVHRNKRDWAQLEALKSSARTRALGNLMNRYVVSRRYGLLQASKRVACEFWLRFIKQLSYAPQTCPPH